ncbi:MAG: pantetheine-phosphate adenylyltransferase [Calditrichia bacterium]
MKNKTAVYPGSFDPITNGHLDIIGRAAAIFDNVYILVAINPSKSPLFKLQERIQMIEEATKELPNVKTATFDGLLVDFAKMNDCSVIIRGLRAISDFEYELQMAMMNKKLAEEIETIFMTPNEKYTYLNSSIVKQVASFGGDVTNFVPENVRKALLQKFS